MEISQKELDEKQANTDSEIKRVEEFAVSKIEANNA